jgi:hypothetical protein
MHYNLQEGPGLIGMRTIMEMQSFFSIIITCHHNYHIWVELSMEEEGEHKRMFMNRLIASWPALQTVTLASMSSYIISPKGLCSSIDLSPDILSKL